MRPRVRVRIRVLVPTTRTLAGPPHTPLPGLEEVPPSPISRTYPHPAPSRLLVRMPILSPYVFLKTDNSTFPSVWDIQSPSYIHFHFISTTLFSGILLFFPRKHHYAVGRGGGERGNLQAVETFHRLVLGIK